MGKYFVVKGLPLALLVEQHFITNKVRVKYQGAYLTEVIKGEYDLIFPDGTTKILSYNKSILGFDYPKMFVDHVEIDYLLPLTITKRTLTMVPGIMILTNGFVGIFFAILVSAFSAKIFKQVNNFPLAILFYLTQFLFFWIIATMTSYALPTIL